MATTERTTTAAAGRPRLRLVRSAARALPAIRVAATITLPSGSYDIRFGSTRRRDASSDHQGPVTDEQRRLDVRQQEGSIMKKIERSLERMIRIAGRFATGLGTMFALLCAVVIVTTDLGPGLPAVRPADVVRLDPVVVTIAADRFDALRAALQGPSALARVPGDDVAPG